MKALVCSTLFFSCLAAGGSMQSVPKELWGSWRITRELPAPTISCWGEKEARTILGSKIEYGAHYFAWKNHRYSQITAELRVVTAEQFHDENSGGGANDSQVSFRDLDIQTKTAHQITINHPDAQITGATSEVPGDQVLLKEPNTVVFSVCNLYFEAKRINTGKP